MAAPAKTMPSVAPALNDAIQCYLKQQIGIVPLPFKSKSPSTPGWTTIRVTLENYLHYFAGGPKNIGVMCGLNNVVDVDLDCVETRVAGQVLLPPTGFVFGRAAAPASHYCYRAAESVPAYQKFKDPFRIGNDQDHACLLELRSLKMNGDVGLQTIVPPSVHPSGEQIVFASGATRMLENIDGDQLAKPVARVASAALFARHFAKHGTQNEAFLALAGILARAEWTEDEALAFHWAIYVVLGCVRWGEDATRQKCKDEVHTTFEKHRSGSRLTGIPRLKELMDPRVVDQGLEWLGIEGQQRITSAQSAAPASRPQRRSLQKTGD